MFTIANAKTVVDAEKSVNKPSENVLWLRRNQKFFQGRDTKFQHFLKGSFFPAKLI